MANPIPNDNKANVNNTINIEFAIDSPIIPSAMLAIPNMQTDVMFLNLLFIFSLARELFTVADLGVQGTQEPRAVDFAKELYFPDDQVVIFPATIGITGEVHQVKG